MVFCRYLIRYAAIRRAFTNIEQAARTLQEEYCSLSKSERLQTLGALKENYTLPELLYDGKNELTGFLIHGRSPFVFVSNKCEDSEKK